MLERFYIRNKAALSSRELTWKTALAHVVAFGLKRTALVKQWLYARRWLKGKRAPGSVVAVGSFFVGGAGKTPFCILLAEALETAGLRVGFIARGYRASRRDVRIVSRGEGPELDAKAAGDEPFLIASRLPHMPFVVGQDRVRAAACAFQLGAEVVIADDALQHRRLEAACEIELRPRWARTADSFFPRGERRDVTRPVDYVVGVDAPEGDIRVQTRVKGVFAYGGRPIDITGARVAAFAGIAHPERFFDTLESLGANLIVRLVLPDHGHLEKESRKQFLQRAMDADWVICTEKDLVKLDTKGMNTLGLGCVVIEHVVTEGRENFEALVASIARSARRQTEPLVS